MTYFLHCHVPGCERENAPPSQQLAESDAPRQSLSNIARLRAKPMDPSQALRADGIVVTGPIQPESTHNDPDPTTFVIVGPAGRWTEYQWINIYDAWVKAFENVSN